jgi:hypothetical protein
LHLWNLRTQEIIVYLGGNLRPKQSYFFIFFLTITLTDGLALAQSSTADLLTGTKDAKALVVVERALAALGGHSVAAQFSTAELTGSITPNGSSEQKAFRWKDQVVGHSYSSRKETQSGQKTNVFVNAGDGDTGIFVPGGKQKKLYSHVGISGAVPLHLPAVALLLALSSPEHSISVIDPAQTGSPIHVRIKTEASVEKRFLSTQDWYFDPTTGLPIRVSYRLANSLNALDSIEAICDYSQFRSFGGMAVPTSMTAFERGQEVAQITVTSVTFGVAVSASEFQLPTEGK